MNCISRVETITIVNPFKALMNSTKDMFCRKCKYLFFLKTVSKCQFIQVSAYAVCYNCGFIYEVNIFQVLSSCVTQYCYVTCRVRVTLVISDTMILVVNQHVARQGPDKRIGYRNDDGR